MKYLENKDPNGLDYILVLGLTFSFAFPIHMLKSDSTFKKGHR